MNFSCAQVPNKQVLHKKRSWSKSVTKHTAGLFTLFSAGNSALCSSTSQPRTHPHIHTHTYIHTHTHERHHSIYVLSTPSAPKTQQPSRRQWLSAQIYSPRLFFVNGSTSRWSQHGPRKPYLIHAPSFMVTLINCVCDWLCVYIFMYIRT